MLEKKQILLLSIAGILGLTSLFMLKVWADKQRQLALRDAEAIVEQQASRSVSVVVANKDIAQGSVIEMSSITERKAGRNEVRPRAATGLASVAGMIAAIPIPAGEQITFNMLVAPQSAGGQAATLAASTPIGKRAITVQVDNISSLAGMIRPGDYVDVITILQVPMTGEDGKQTAQPALIPLFQNILVLAVGQQTGATPQASSRYKKEEPSKAEYSPLITLGLSPQEANLLAFVQEQGKIRLVLRSPADSRLENVQVVTSGNLITFLQSIFGGQGKEEEPVEPLEGQYLEVYRGLKKDKVLIGQ